MAIARSVLPVIPLLMLMRRHDYGHLPSASHIIQTAASSSPLMMNQRDHWDREYDYIIVGGGSAGSVLANRLSEDAYVKVLLLEAGGSENIISDIPLAYQSLQQTPMDWKYVTEPQQAACFGLNSRVGYYTTTKFFLLKEDRHLFEFLLVYFLYCSCIILSTNVFLNVLSLTNVNNDTRIISIGLFSNFFIFVC